jgi:rRNA processing protein Krr1/Pno1
LAQERAQKPQQQLPVSREEFPTPRMAETGELSKSAKKRANQKARAAAEAEAAAPAPPPPAPAAAPKGKAKAKPEAKAKAEPKAQPKAEPKAEPKAKGKAKAEPKAPAEPKPEPKAEPKAAASKAKAGAKGKAKAKAAPVKEEEPEPVKKVEELINYVIDDGTGGDWAVSSGLNAKAAKRKQKMDEEKAIMEQMKKEAGGKVPKNMVPGMAPMDPRAAAQAVAAARASTNQAASADVARILAKKEEESVAAANVSVATIEVPDKKIGIVIGPGGNTVKTIQEKTKVKIDTVGGLFTITGPGPAVAEAEAAIKELITKNFCSLLYEDFSENYVSVSKNYFPDIIGKGGEIIQKIKKELKVEVSIPPGTDTAPDGKKFKVTLAGSAKQVEEAKEVITSIIMYGHHEITHPGKTHRELEVESWKFSFLIGKGGSELKHIQKNWDVKVNIPRATSVNQNVLIVGDESNVERAATYVEKVLWNAENNVRSGRDKVDDGDTWGDEEDDEPWMKDYIYKRH